MGGWCVRWVGWVANLLVGGWEMGGSSAGGSWVSGWLGGW